MRWFVGFALLVMGGCSAALQQVTPSRVLEVLKEAGYKDVVMKPCSSSTSGMSDCQDIVIGRMEDYAKDPVHVPLPTSINVVVFKDKAAQDSVGAMGSALGITPIRKNLTSISTLGGKGSEVSALLEKKL